MGSFKKILPPQPHYLSGYAGFVPGYKSYCGQSYGKLTHDLFFDKTVQRSNVPVLSDLTNVYEDTNCTHEEEESINKRCENNLSCKYTTDIIPGYAGYVPQYVFLCGNKYTADATRGINNFVKILNSCSCPECAERKQGRSVKFDKKILDVEADVKIENAPMADVLQNVNECKCTDIVPMAGVLQSGSEYTEIAQKADVLQNGNEYTEIAPKSDVLQNVNEYTHPFKKDLEGEKLFKEQHKPTLPVPPSDTTYFLENGNPYKKFMAGYAGHVPSLLFEFGQSYTPATKDALNIFTDQCVKHKLSTLTDTYHLNIAQDT